MNLNTPSPLYFEAVAYIAGNAKHVFELHKRIVEADINDPASFFGYRRIFVLNPRVAAIAYRSARAGAPTSLEAVLYDSSEEVRRLDVCVYVSRFSSEGSSIFTYCQNEPKFENEVFGIDTALQVFTARSLRYGFEPKDWAIADKLVDPDVSAPQIDGMG